MQDGARISGEEASRWLKEHFAGEAEPEITMTWNVIPDEPEDEAALHPLLDLLFGPPQPSPERAP